jgi:hypothetical protein
MSILRQKNEAGIIQNFLKHIQFKNILIFKFVEVILYL